MLHSSCVIIILLIFERMKKSSVLLLVTLLWVISFVAGCAHSAKDTQVTNNTNTLDWLTNMPAEFASNKYITAIGSGITPEQAAENARAAIAQAFVVRIRQHNYQLRQISEQDGEATVQHHGGNSTRSLTDEVLEGVPIVRQGIRTAEGRWYALAALNKSRAANRMRHAMDALDEQIKDTISNLPTAQPLRRVVLLTQAQRFLQQRSEIMSRYAVVASGVYPSEYQHYDFKQQLAAVRAQATLTVTIKSNELNQDDLRAMQSIITDILQDKGYQVTTDGLYQLHINLHLHSFIKRRSWYWQRIDLDWNLYNTQDTAQQLAVGRASTRVATTQQNTLLTRLQKQVRTELPVPLITSLEESK